MDGSIKQLITWLSGFIRVNKWEGSKVVPMMGSTRKMKSQSFITSSPKGPPLLLSYSIARSESLGSAHTQGKGIIKGVYTRGVEILPQIFS